MTGRWRLAGWAAAMALGLRALHALGAGTLGVPLSSVDDLSAWLDRTPPEVMAVAMVRLVALAAGWYMAVCTLVLAVTRPFGRTRVASAAARATPAVIRRLVAGGGGLGLAAGTLVGGVPAWGMASTALAPKPAAASIVDAVQDPGPPTATMRRGPRGMPTAVMTRMPAEDVPAAAMTRAPATEAPPASRAPPAHATVDAATAASPSWTVEPGDSFWSIAAETVVPGGGAPDDRRVIGYWRRLVEANRGRLLDPNNPDLLVPGQELVMPDPDG
jgi:hypothetical protein